MAGAVNWIAADFFLEDFWEEGEGTVNITASAAPSLPLELSSSRIPADADLFVMTRILHDWCAGSKPGNSWAESEW